MNTIRSAAVLVLLAVLATACSGGDDDAAPTNTVAPTESAESTTTTSTTRTSTTTATSTTTTTTSTTTTVAAGTDEEQIEALIEEYWQVIAVAFDPPNPASALFATVATTRLAGVLSANAQGVLDQNQGIAALSPGERLVLASDIVVIEGFAIVFACVVDAGKVYDLETEETIREASLLSVKRMEAILTAEGWRVENSETLDRLEPGEVEACVASFPAS